MPDISIDSIDDRGPAASPLRVAIVAPIMARYDAISVSAHNYYCALRQSSVYAPVVLTYRNDFRDVDARIISCVSELLVAPEFLDADVIVYEFGVYAPLFDAMLVGNGRARQAVHFHNITPAEFVPDGERATIKRVFVQLENLRHAHEVWAVSDVNAALLEARGFPRHAIRSAPLGVNFPSRMSASDKTTDRIEFLFVGRIVPSKGLLDLVEAFDALRCSMASPARLSIAGNLEFSHPSFVEAVRDRISTSSNADCIEFCGTVDDTELERLYHRSNIFVIPSYHEGFCKPVIEALRAGCIPIVYNAYNLPFIVNGLGRVVETGNVAALSAAMADVSTCLQKETQWTLPLDCGFLTPLEFDSSVSSYLERFQPDKISALLRDLTSSLATGHSQKVIATHHPALTRP